MIQPGRSFSAGSGYRYGFNGKENDNEVKGEGNSLDFGARIYDPRIGKFLSVDFFSTANNTPYSFAGNDPVNYIDYNGNFKISPFFVKRYPTLAKMLELVLPALAMDEQMMERWITNVGFDNHGDGVKAWKEMLTFGSGPWVTPNRPMSELKDYYNWGLGTFFGSKGEGEYERRYPNNITVGWGVLDALETAIKNGDGKEIGYRAFVVMMQVMHEGGHWARFMKAKKMNRTGAAYEDGAMVEEAITGGTRFSYNNWQSADISANGFDHDKIRSYYNNLYNSNIVRENQLKNKGVFIPFTGACMGTGTLRMKIPQGQRGDPTLGDNNDKEPKVFIQSNSNNDGSKRSSSSNLSYEY